MADLAEFLAERLKEFDPTIDTSSGSLAQQVIIEPAVTRFGADPFDIDIRTFLIDRVKQEFPLVDVNRTALDDLLIKPQAIMLEPFRREILSVETQQSLEDPALLTEDEADALVANFAVARVAGNRAQGIARLFFNAPVTFTALPSQTLSTSDGLAFNPTSVQSITSSQMQSNVDSGFYFFDITVVAVDEGTDGQLEPNELTQIAGAPGVVRVTNNTRFSGGVDRQTNVELKDFTIESITERSLTTDRGVVSQILANFAVEDVFAIGYGDPEMERDIVDVIGNVLTSETGVVASIVTSVLTDATAAFLVDDVRVGDVLTLFSGPNFGRSFSVTIVTAMTLTLSGSPLDDAGPLSYFVTQQNPGIVTISSIPGGILSDPPLSIPNSEIHIGNHVDAYVKAPVFDQGTLILLRLPAPDDDKDLSDIVHLDVDLISYRKASSIGSSISGGDTLTTEAPLRKFGLVKNDIIRFTAPSDYVAVGDLRIIAIDDDDPMILTLEDAAVPGSPFSAPSPQTGAAFDLLSTNNGIVAEDLPFVRVTEVHLANGDDPPTAQPDQPIPYRNPVDVRSTDFFSGGANPSIGRFRLYFLEPTAFQVDAETGLAFKTLFKIERDGATLYYKPDPDAGIGDLGPGVKKVRDPDLADATPIDTGAGTGTFPGPSPHTFTLVADTFAVNIDEDDMLVITDGAFVSHNFYVTTGVLSGGTTIQVTPAFDGVLPTTGLDWSIVAKEDIASQRISAKSMALNQEGSLFFMDVAANSADFNLTGDPAVFPGDDIEDLFNIPEGLLAEVSDFRSLGYFFKQNTNPGSLRDSSLAFSIFERLIMSFTDRFMTSDVSDPTMTTGKPAAFLISGATNNNALPLESNNVEVKFEKAPVVQEIQEFVDSGTGRVITENILIKHMIPAFVDLVISYSGGLPEATVEDLLTELIDETDSDENLSASDIDFLMRRRGEATDVTMPLGLVAVVHNQDRTITVERSEDALVVGRISHFFPGVLDITRR